MKARITTQEKTLAVQQVAKKSSSLSPPSYGLSFIDNQSVQRKENKTGLPDQLKEGVESLSGMNLGDVKVHYNSSKPAQLNALAYAQGAEIHLGAGQEKHLPHEAWHVAQQKQGRVKPTTQMKGTPINDNSGLESEAEGMGKKALAFNGVDKETTPGNSSSSVLQGYFKANAQDVFMLAQEKRKTSTGDTFLNESGKANVKANFGGTMRISNDKKMAIEDGSGKRQAKTFYATTSVLSAANGVLTQIGSPIRLVSHSGIAISLEEGKGPLSLVYPIDLKAKKIGLEVEVPQRCNETAPYIAHTKSDETLKPLYHQGNKQVIPRHKLLHTIDLQLAALLPLLLKKQSFEDKGIVGMFFESFLPWWKNFYPELQMLQTAGVMDFYNHMEKIGKVNNHDSSNDNIKRGSNILAKRYIEEFINKTGADRILKEIGLNEFIDPKMGDVLSIRSIGMGRDDQHGNTFVHDNQSGREMKNPFPYHFATVIAKSGNDYITMENYARQGEEGDQRHPLKRDDPRYFFQMFGPLKQSFHSENKADYPNAMTLAFSPDRATVNYDHDLGSQPVDQVVKSYNKKLDTVYRS